MTGLFVLVSLAVMAALAARYGVDTRDGRDWSARCDRHRGAPPRAHRTVGSDLRALAGLLRRAGRRLAEMWDAQERAWGACWRSHQPWRGDDPPPRRGVDSSPWRGALAPLHWREADGGWRLEGRLLPCAPPTGEPSSEPSARRD